jgi:hypothetical protein
MNNILLLAMIGTTAISLMDIQSLHGDVLTAENRSRYCDDQDTELMETVCNSPNGTPYHCKEGLSGYECVLGDEWKPTPEFQKNAEIVLQHKTVIIVSYMHPIRIQYKI